MHSTVHKNMWLEIAGKLCSFTALAWSKRRQEYSCETIDPPKDGWWFQINLDNQSWLGDPKIDRHSKMIDAPIMDDSMCNSWDNQSCLGVHITRPAWDVSGIFGHGHNPRLQTSLRRKWDALPNQKNIVSMISLDILSISEYIPWYPIFSTIFIGLYFILHPSAQLCPGGGVL